MSHVILLMILASLPIGVFSQPIHVKESEVEKWISPSILLDEGSSKGCRMTMMYPRSFEQVSCGTDASGPWGASMMIAYFRLLDQAPDTFKTLEGGVYRKNFQEFMHSGAKGIVSRSNQDDSVIRDRQGIARIDSITGCNQTLSSEVVASPIQGSNWNGWLWEHHFDLKNKNVPRECKNLAQYRCFALALGNDSMSMVFPTECLARKRVADNDPAASFDVFMDMIKTIRFTEGSAIKPPPR